MSTRISNSHRSRIRQSQPQPQLAPQQAKTAINKSSTQPSPQDKLVKGQGNALAAKASGASLADSSQFRGAYAKASQQDRQLLDNIKNAPNGEAAFQTYQGLRSGTQDPNRMSDTMVKDMVMGVANTRGEGAHNSEGLLSQTHAMNAKNALLAMPSAQFQKFQRTYNSAGTGGANGVQAGSDPGTERQLLLKSLGARSGALTGSNPELANQAMNQIATFGKEINGTNAQKLMQQTSPLQTDNNKGYMQKHGNSCSAATKMTMLAENDPIYARSLNGNSMLQNAEIEKTLLESQGDLSEGGLSAAGTNGLYNTHAGDPNVHYTDLKMGPGGLAQHIDDIADAVAKGYDVPIASAIGKNAEGNISGHAMNICAVSGEPPNRTFSIHDTGGGGSLDPNTTSGLTRQVAEKDLIDGSFLKKNFGYDDSSFANQHVFNVQLPQTATQRFAGVRKDLGIVGQTQVDQGFMNAANEQNGNHVAPGNTAAAHAQEQPQQQVHNPDLDDGIPIKDDFGIEDNW